MDSNISITGALKKVAALLTPKEKRTAVGLLIMMIVGALLEVVSLGLFPLMVSVIADPSLLKKYPSVNEVLLNAGIDSSEKLLLYGSATLIAVFIIKNLFIGFLHYLRINYVMNAQVRLSVALLGLYFKAPYTFHLTRNTTDMYSKVSDEVRLIINSILLPALALVMDALMSIAILILLVSIEPFVSMITVLIFALSSVLFVLLIRKKAKRFGMALPFLRSDMHKNVYEGLGGFKDARVLKRENHFIRKTGEALRNFADASKHQQIVGQWTKPFLETITIVGMLSIASAIVIEGRPMSSILSVLALFSISAIRLLPSVNSILAGYTGIKTSLFTIDPVYNDFRQLGYTPAPIEETTNVMSFNNSIDIRNVSYNYPTAAGKSLDNVNLTIRKGTAIGLVGSSGAGKTTLVDVILGLLEPGEGQIVIDGKDDIHSDIGAWQRNIGYIPQSIYLADSSIRKNIAFGIDEAEIDNEKMMSAVKAAQLESLINDLPEGLETEIGERGVRLSGGQRQRIGIARALYHNPQVLIMDEATSALDNITEKYVVEAIERLKGDRTIITIAHRLTTVKNCDCLYLMKHGRIIASGTYDELLTHSAEFKEMNV